MIRDTTSSPTQPNPKLASVMPNCVAAKNPSRLETTISAAFFENPDCKAIWEPRTFTMANSAATKKPFKKTRKSVKKISKTIYRLGEKVA
jgi:hypothetical protein